MLTKPKLSILIPSLEKRLSFRVRLMGILNPQLNDDVEVISRIDDGSMTVGAKRNLLLEDSKADYIVFIDDDDLIEPFYVSKVLKALEKGPDVVGIHLLHYEDGFLKGFTHHSIKYNHWFQEPNKDQEGMTNYYRNPNHLNPVKREFAVKAGFPSIDFGEDRYYSQHLYDYLVTEEDILEPIYSYYHRNQK
jgi:glycosyltransferase involved in cell wall biosynthesis